MAHRNVRNIDVHGLAGRPPLGRIPPQGGDVPHVDTPSVTQIEPELQARAGRHRPIGTPGRAQDAARAFREFGFTRMWSIHPSQIRAIVAAYAPPAAEVDDATAILLAARAASWGPTQYQGALHDRASYRYYWTVLQRARLSGLPLTADALSLL